MAKANERKGFEHIHYFLVGALENVDRALWPARFHLGGPLPVLTYDAQPRVAHVVATHARPLADDVAAFDRLARIIETVGKGMKRDALDTATKATKSDPPALKVARTAARAVYNFRYAAESAKNIIGKCITTAAITYVQNVQDPRPFLAALDAVIVREELRDKLTERRIKPSSPIARVISRPRTGKSLALGLAVLEDGTYGLLVKLKNAWQWHEGDRATVFATVPDPFMEQVAADLG